MGLSDDRNYARYHQVLKWHPARAAAPASGPGRWSVDLRHRRNPLAALKSNPWASTACGALQPEPPGQGQRSALDLPDVARSPGRDAIGPCPFSLCWRPYHRQRGRRHKKLTDWARQMILQLRRWLPQRPLVLVRRLRRPDLLHCCQSATRYAHRPLARASMNGPAPSAGPRSAPAERPTAARAEITRRPSRSVLDHRRGSLQRHDPHGGTHLANGGLVSLGQAARAPGWVLVRDPQGEHTGSAVH